MTRDLTTGHPLRRILLFCFPLLIGSLFQQAYTLADSVIIAKYLGVSSFAAVGSTSSFHTLIVGFALGFCSGLCIPVAQHFGSRNISVIRRTVLNGLYMVVAVSLFIGVVMTLLARPILILLRTPSDILDESCTYISIIFAGVGIILIYNLCLGCMRALGDSRTPFFILVICCLLNIALDLLFVVTFHMGVAGVAYATLLSQLLSTLLCLYAIRKHFPLLHFTKKDTVFSFSIIKSLCAISIPVGLQFFITSMGSVLLQASINSLGSDVVAAASAGSKVQTVLLAPLDCAGIAIATFASQNLGANRLDRIRQGSMQTMLACSIYSFLAFWICRAFGTSLSKIFLHASDPAILAMTQQYLNLNTLFYISLSVIYVYRNTLQGLGRANATMFAGVPELIGRTIIALFFVTPYGYAGACFGNPAAWTLAALVLLPMYRSAIRKLQKELPA